MKNLILPFVALWLFNSSCNTQKNGPTAAEQQSAFDTMLDNYYERGLELNPVSATFEGVATYNDQFPDILSDAYKKEVKAYYTRYLDSLSQFPDSILSEDQQMSKAVLKWECDINLEGFKFHSEYLPITQMWSINLVMAQLATGTSAQPFTSEADYLNWLKRSEGFVTWLSSAEAKMKEGVEKGYVLPKSLIVKIIPQIESLAIENTEEHIFYSPIKLFPASFSDSLKLELTHAYVDFIRNKLVPQSASLHSYLKEDYLAAGRASSGIWDIPDGEAYYNYLIKYFTTTDMTADEIHELGLKEVERILAEMEKVKKQVGFKGDIKAFLNYVRDNKALMPYTEPQQVLDHFEDIHNRMKPQLAKLFDHTPKTPFVVKRTEKFREKTASAGYVPGAVDGSRPGTFYVPIPDVSAYNIFTDETLFLHEAIPGHHYQISLTQENPNLPKFRKTLWYSGYGEGWALYCESMGKELGLFTNPYQYFGNLSDEMLRAVRLVVDTGIHFKKWTREEAIKYSLEHESESEQKIIMEIERYMAGPGQALSYKIGQLKIMELRDNASKSMGDNFDIRAFHNQVLSTGCVPLNVLEQKIDTWVANN